MVLVGQNLADKLCRAVGLGVVEKLIGFPGPTYQLAFC
jgi:hypothetical protein